MPATPAAAPRAARHPLMEGTHVMLACDALTSRFSFASTRRLSAQPVDAGPLRLPGSTRLKPEALAAWSPSRLLCPDPQVPPYPGSGDSENAASFACR